MLSGQARQDALEKASEKGDWVVDRHDTSFGEVLEHGLGDGVIFMVLPKVAGWKPMDKSVMLAHQTYAKHVAEWIDKYGPPQKIAVLNVNEGERQTVWETKEKWRLSNPEA